MRGRRGGCRLLGVESTAVTWAQVVVLALVQGVTEFLPVSSSAHLVLPAALTDWPDQGLAFDVAVHAGTLVAVVWYLRCEMRRIAAGGWTLLARRQVDANARLAAKVALATVPVVAVGFAFGDVIEARLRGVGPIAATTICFGLALLWADRRRGGAAAPATPTFAQALVIGSAQALALAPGVSRAGVTITAALALGLARGPATRFAFLLAVPAIAGATVLMAGDVAHAAVPWPMLLAGFALAAVTALLCMAAFARFVERTGMLPYVVYRLGLGCALLLLL